MLLITQQEVIDYAFGPTDTLSADSVRVAKIMVAQQRFIRPRLGDGLYFKLFTDKHRDFVENYIKAPLAHYVRYGVLSDIALHVGDNGIVQLDSTNNEDKYTLLRSDKSDKINESNDLVNIDENLTQKGRITTTGNDLNENSTTATTILNATKNANQTTTADNAAEEQVIKEQRKQYDGYNTAQSVTISNATDTSQKQIENRGSKIDTQTDKGTTERTQEDAARKQSDSISNSEKTNATVRTDSKEHLDSENITRQVNDTTNRTISHRAERAATDAQCRGLAQRALYEANILMSCTMQYIEANPQQFPEYCSPATRIVAFARSLIF